MSNILDLIVSCTEYRESDMTKLLNSISNQGGVDFGEIGIIIINSGYTTIKKGVFKKYPFLNISYYENTSNDVYSYDYAVSKSIAEYVTFISMEDEICGNGLSSLVSYLKNGNNDLIVTNVQNQKNSQYKFFSNDLFGLIIRRNVFDVFNIRIDNSLIIFNEFCFRNILSICLYQCYLDIHFYKKNSDNNIVEQIKNHFDDFMSSIDKTNEYMIRNNIFTIKHFLVNTYILYYINLVILNNSNCDYLNNYLEKYKKYIFESNLFFDKFKLTILECLEEIGINNDKVDKIDFMSNDYHENINDFILDIIVPYYNEKYDILKKLLDSINKQINLDFSDIQITLVSDNPNNIFDISMIEKEYPNLYIVQYNKNSNMGPGQARQYGLDKSNSKYVTFYDTDDLMFEPDGLSKIMYYLKAFEYDVIYSKYYVVQDDKISISDCNNLLCLHGAFYNREVLLKNGFKFHDRIIYFEDMHFCTITNICLNTKMLDYPTYVWLRRENSASKLESNDMNIIFKEKKDDFMEANYSIIDFCLNHLELMKLKFYNLNLNSDYKIAEFFVGCLYYIFIFIESDIFYDINIDKYEKAIYYKYLELKKYFDVIDNSIKKNIFYEKSKTIMSDNGVKEIRKSFDDFLNCMEGKNR